MESSHDATDQKTLPSHDVSQASSTTPSRQPSIRTTKHDKATAKVKFSMGDSDDEAESDSAVTGDIPSIVLPEAEPRGPPLLQTPDWSNRAHTAAIAAQQTAHRLAVKLSPSASASRNSSTSESSRVNASNHHNAVSPYSSPPLLPLSDHPIKLDDIPLEPLQRWKTGHYDIDDSDDDDDDDSDAIVEEPVPKERSQKPESEHMADAKRLFRTMTRGMGLGHSRVQTDPRLQMDPRLQTDVHSGTATPAIDKHVHDLEYVAPPDEYKPGLTSLLISKLANFQNQANPVPTVLERQSGFSRKLPSAIGTTSSHHNDAPAYSHNDDSLGSSRPLSGSHTPVNRHKSSGHSSGTTTPRKTKWYDDADRKSTSSLGTLVQSTLSSAVPAAPGMGKRPALPRSRSSGMIAQAVDIIKHPAAHFKPPPSYTDIEREATEQLADIIARRKYLIKLCRCFMMYGAPSHRLEEYMRTSARTLKIRGSFLYVPGCMIVSFDDDAAQSSHVSLVKVTQAVDLGRFKDAHRVYKCVIHEKYNAETAIEELDAIMSKSDEFSTIFRILAYGFASVSVGPFAFSARPIDFGPNFLLGCLLGWMQLTLVPASEQFSHVFEVLAALVTSFISRGLGSIAHNGTPIFCFSAMAQSSIALILPGYTILCAALELQSRNLVSGSVRMVYAIIYSLFLGFGILIGTTLFGLMDPAHATSSETCVMPSYWQGEPKYQLLYTKFIWVPIFTICLAVINQAKWRQMPMMVLISVAGEQANYWLSTRISNNVQVANAIGALAIGTIANLYSRFGRGLAAAAMLPAIFVQVPSGLAASGSLVAGLTSANQITGNATGISIINNGTQGFIDAANSTSSSSDLYGGTIWNVGYGMVQVAIGISVGLYLSALFVYPFGKHKSGLFSF